MPDSRLILAASVPLLLTSAALAIDVNVAPDLDNTLYQDPLGSLSNGAGAYLFAGFTGQGSERRALLRFPIAQFIPPGATISNVSLHVVCLVSAVNAAPLSIHRVLASWGEGTSDAGSLGGAGTTATTGDATWLHRFYNTTFWHAP